MAAGQLYLNSVTDDQGKVHQLSESAHFGLKQDGMLINGVYRPSDSKPWLAAWSTLSMKVVNLCRSVARCN